MSDIEKEHDQKPVPPTNDDNITGEGDAFTQTSLRELVLSAGAALGDLTADGVAQEAAETPSEPAAGEKKKRGKKSSKKKVTEEAPLQAPESDIQWNESTSELSFIEDTENLKTSKASTISQFEELAKRVAETAALKDVLGDVEDHNADFAGAPADTTEEIRAEMAAIATHSLDPADDEISVLSEEAVDELLEGVSFAVEAAPGAEPAAEMEQMDLETFGEDLQAAEDDADPEPTEFVEHERMISVIESLLFSTDKPVSVATIKQIFKGSNVRSKDIAAALDGLASEYASMVRGVTLEEVNGGYQLRTKSDNAEYLRRLAKVRPFRLSGPALEVMAIVAYKQPITKHEIDQIRGVESGHLLRALMERGLMAFGGKSDLPGKPMTYNTTRKFLETFGLRNLRELPTLSEIDEILPEGIGEVEEKETLSDITDSMSQQVTSSYSEGEDELQKINDQLQAVETSSEFFEQEKIRERERRDRERAQDIREKMVMGEAVETKDKRWLERYDAKLLEPKVPVEAALEAQEATGPYGEAAHVPAIEPEVEEENFGSQLEALTEESANENMHEAEETADEKMDRELAEHDAEDLIANQGWDDDAENEI